RLSMPPRDSVPPWPAKPPSTTPDQVGPLFWLSSVCLSLRRVFGVSLAEYCRGPIAGLIVLAALLCRIASLQAADRYVAWLADGRLSQASSVRLQLEPPLMPVTGTALSVRTDRIQRIVAGVQPAAAELPPGTVVLADGRRLLARSIRWREYGLAILTADGVHDA